MFNNNINFEFRVNKKRKSLINHMLKRYNPISERIETSFQKAPDDIKDMFCDRLVKLTKNQISRRIGAAIVHKFDKVKLKDIINNDYDDYDDY